MPVQYCHPLKRTQKQHDPTMAQSVEKYKVCRSSSQDWIMSELLFLLLTTHGHIRDFPRDLIMERRLMNIHAYNLFMSSIFITYKFVFCCWQESQKHSLPKAIVAVSMFSCSNYMYMYVGLKLTLIRLDSWIVLAVFVV